MVMRVLIASLAGLAVIALLALIMVLIPGLFGMLIAFGVVAALGALWGMLDERRLEQQYKEDTKCS